MTRMRRPLRVRLSDWRYHATRQAGRPFRALERRVLGEDIGNWRRRRFAETGKGYRLERATRGVRSRLPVYRNRVNPATGRPRRDDAEIYRRRDAALEARRQDRVTVREALARSREADRARVREHADRVPGRGRSR